MNLIVFFQDLVRQFFVNDGNRSDSHSDFFWDIYIYIHNIYISLTSFCPRYGSGLDSRCHSPIFLMLQRTSPELSADFIRKSAPLTGSEEEVTDQEESNDEETGESLPERIKTW